MKKTISIIMVTLITGCITFFRKPPNSLFLAIERNNGQKVTQILANTEPFNLNAESNSWGRGTPLQFAVRKNRPQIVEILLKHGADPAIGFRYEHLLNYAAKRGFMRTAELLVRSILRLATTLRH